MIRDAQNAGVQGVVAWTSDDEVWRREVALRIEHAALMLIKELERLRVIVSKLVDQILQEIGLG